VKSVLFLGFLLALLSRLSAQPQKAAVPDTLTPAQTQQVDSIEKTVKIRRCCEGDLFSCLQKKNQCAIARHLDGLVRWLVAKRTSPAGIADEVDKRYESLVSARKGKIDTTVFPMAGDPHAPVLIEAYVSGTCPLCHYITRELYAAVSSGGRLFGKARLMVKPLGASPGNLCMCAANELGRFWDFFIAVSNVKIRADSAVVFKVADSIGITTSDLARLMKDPTTRAMAQASTREAGANGVTVAPTVFFNNVRYRSYKDPRWLVDAAEYLYEAESGPQ
jgi:protein-disulfide isomerase